MQLRCFNFGSVFYGRLAYLTITRLILIPRGSKRKVVSVENNFEVSCSCFISKIHSNPFHFMVYLWLFECNNNVFSYVFVKLLHCFPQSGSKTETPRRYVTSILLLFFLPRVKCSLFKKHGAGQKVYGTEQKLNVFLVVTCRMVKFERELSANSTLDSRNDSLVI